MCVYYHDGLEKNLMVYVLRGISDDVRVVRICCMYMLPSDEVPPELQLTFLCVVSIYMENVLHDSLGVVRELG